MSDTGPPDASPKAEDQTEAPAAMEAAEAPTKKVPEPISFREFLESTPPGRMADVARVCEHKRTQASTYQFFELIAPDIRLHCPSADCKGMLYFRFIDGNRTFGREDKEIETFMTYRCSNCRNTTKRYSLYVERKSDFDGKCYKFGELPAFGPVTPTRLLDLFGKDRDIFLKGRRCESQGLGIGAFVYYRRVVESHKNQILDEVIKVCQKLAMPADMLTALEEAKNETQFSRALASVKNAIPQALLIDGHNPLTLLHDALSGGLHNKSDADCLGLAQDVRVVLADLADSIAQALREQAELKTAVSRLLKANREGSR